jgi:hypothetical protein
VDVHHLGIDKAAIISTLFPIAGTIGTLSFSWLVGGPFCCKEIGFAIKIYIGKWIKTKCDDALIYISPNI